MSPLNSPNLREFRSNKVRSISPLIIFHEYDLRKVLRHKTKRWFIQIYHKNTFRLDRTKKRVIPQEKFDMNYQVTHFIQVKRRTYRHCILKIIIELRKALKQLHDDANFKKTKGKTIT